jgi:hypothetical protein
MIVTLLVLAGALAPARVAHAQAVFINELDWCHSGRREASNPLRSTVIAVP